MMNTANRAMLIKPGMDGKQMKTIAKKARVNDHDMDDKDKKRKKKGSPIKHSGSFEGKSNQLGQGGRAAQMRARGVPGGVIGAIARREGAAPGQPNYHKRGKK